MTELKPCPFCGGDARIGHSHDENVCVYYSVLCTACNIGIFKFKTKENVHAAFESETEAAEAWNRRVDDGTIH